MLNSYDDEKLIYCTKKTEVWLSKNLKTGEQVVKKLINKTKNSKLLDIYDVLKNNEHINLPKIYEYVELEDKYCIIEEYVPAKSLGEQLEYGIEFKKKDVIKIMKQLCKVMTFLHEKNIIHRDIKPFNIIMQHSGIIKLIDFDSARFYNEEASKDTRYLGTKGYAPPEQYGYSQTDIRADIYAIGVTAYELLTHKLPEENNFKYRGRLGRIIRKCSKFDPDKRFKNTKELYNALIKLYIKKTFDVICIAFLVIVLAFNIRFFSVYLGDKIGWDRTFQVIFDNYFDFDDYKKPDVTIMYNIENEFGVTDRRIMNTVKKKYSAIEFMNYTKNDLDNMFYLNYECKKVNYYDDYRHIYLKYGDLPYIFQFDIKSNGNNSEEQECSGTVKSVIVDRGGSILQGIQCSMTLESLETILDTKVAIVLDYKSGANYATFYVDEKYKVTVYVRKETNDSWSVYSARITEEKKLYNQLDSEIKHYEVSDLPIYGNWKIDTSNNNEYSTINISANDIQGYPYFIEYINEKKDEIVLMVNIDDTFAKCKITVLKGKLNIIVYNALLDLYEDSIFFNKI